MPPRIRIAASPKALAVRPRPQRQWRTPVAIGSHQATRAFADRSKDLPESADGKGPNMDQLPHISEEAAATKKAMGEQGPDLTQGTPVNEVLKNDKAAHDKLPKVMKDAINAGSKRSFSTMAKRQFSTSTRRLAADLTTYQGNAVIPPEMIYHSPAYAAFVSRFPQQVRETALAELPVTHEETALTKEAMPERPLHHHRYDPILEQMVGLMIRHGKKSVAQRNMVHILSQLRTSPPPTIDPRHPLIAGAPPAAQLPLNPVLYLQLVIDSVAPLMRIRSIRGAAGGGMALQLPMPLGQRQRRRVAMKWILDAASKRKDSGSGKTGFAQRVAQELISVAEGRSAVWDRRNGLHKMGVAARANLNTRTMRR